MLKKSPLAISAAALTPLILKSCKSGFRQKSLPLLLVAMTIFVQITGCGPLYEYEYTKHKIFGGGIISDTTAILFEDVTDNYHRNRDFGVNPSDHTEHRGYNLILVDIRFEKIYWRKSIDNVIVPFRLEIIDSDLFLNSEEYFSCHLEEQKDCSIYKIAVINMDEKFHQSEKIDVKYKDIRLKSESWYSRSRIRPWKDGLMLAYKSGYYALIDTASGTMELWQPSGEFEWLNECSDYKWSNTGGLCLKNIPDTSGFMLLKNGIDTLAVRYRGGSKISFFSGNSVNSQGSTYLISKQGQVSEKHLNVFADGNFYELNGSFYDLDWNLLVDYNKEFKR